MGLAVVTTASGGLPVTDVTAVAPLRGLPVTEAANGRGVRVTKVAALGLPVIYETIGVAALNTGWNPVDKTTMALSNGNLTAISTANLSGVRAVRGASSGKFYVEYTMEVWGASNTGAGIGLAAAGLSSGANGLKIAALNKVSGAVYIDSGLIVTFGGRASGQIIGMAVDLSAALIWFRIAPAGNWNNSAPANPATGVGGLSFSSISGVMFPLFATTTTGDKVVANFGDSAFSGAVPSGFTAGWPA